jgi:hypothetical protein
VGIFSFCAADARIYRALDLLLLTLAETRRVRRDGIRFSGYRYFDVSLSGYIGEDVTIRYDDLRKLQYLDVRQCSVTWKCIETLKK